MLQRMYGATTDETNPLVNDKKSNDSDPMAAIKVAMNSAAAASAVEFARNKIEEVKHLATEGPLTFQVLALIGGVAMAVQSVFGSMGKFFSFSPLQMMIEVYCGIFGLLTIILEGNDRS